MKTVIQGGARTGRIEAPPSKSYMQRYLLLSFLGRQPLSLDHVGELPLDLWDLIRCLSQLGMQAEQAPGRLKIAWSPLPGEEEEIPFLPIGENGTGLRFLLPALGVFGLTARLKREESLARRPLGPLKEALEKNGQTVREAGAYLQTEGRLRPGHFELPGNVSSQFISGLLLALPFLPGDSSLFVRGKLSSGPYVDMSLFCLREGGIRIREEKSEEGSLFRIPGRQTLRLPDSLRVPGDWSGAAAFLALGALSPSGIAVEGLRPDPLQADSRLEKLLRQMGARLSWESPELLSVRKGRLTGLTADVDDCPDLLPVLAALCACAEGGSLLTGGGRLKYKESERLSGTASLLRSLGAEVSCTEDSLSIGGGLTGGSCDSLGDHRLAMAAAVAAGGLEPDRSVELTGALAVGKSFPGFWREWKKLDRDEA